MALAFRLLLSRGLSGGNWARASNRQKRKLQFDGFQSRASLSATAISAGDILAAASSRASLAPGSPCAAARLQPHVGENVVLRRAKAVLVHYAEIELGRGKAALRRPAKPSFSLDKVLRRPYPCAERTPRLNSANGSSCAAALRYQRRASS